WLDRRAGDRPKGGLAGTGPLQPDIAHQPSLAYVPYLVTGDRYYADEMAFWGNYVLIGTFQDSYYNRRGGGMIHGPGSNSPVHPGSWGSLMANEVRGIGWGLRNLVDAAAYLPDTDPMKRYFASKIANNLSDLDAYAYSLNNPIGVTWEDNRPENRTRLANGYQAKWVAMWGQ